MASGPTARPRGPDRPTPADPDSPRVALSGFHFFITSIFARILENFTLSVPYGKHGQPEDLQLKKEVKVEKI